MKRLLLAALISAFAAGSAMAAGCLREPQRKRRQGFERRCQDQHN